MAISELELAFSEGSLFTVHGPPGTGKTHYLRDQVSRASEKYGSSKVVALSYTKAAAVELRGRLDLPDRNVGTLHSLCLRSIRTPGEKLKLADSKIKEFNDSQNAFRLSNSGKADVSDPLHDDCKTATAGDKARADAEIFRAGMVPLEKWSERAQRFYTAWKAWKEANDYIDFADMLEIALHDVAACPGDPAVIVGDEIQDSSRLQLALVLKWSKAARTTILAHDVDQAIYTWAGADPAALLDLDVPEANKRHLKQSYRLPRAVHAVAEAWVKKLFRRDARPYSPRDADGSVRRFNARWKYPEPLLRLIDDRIGQGKTVMITATCRYLLGPLMAILRKRGIPFHNPWRAKDGGFNPLRHGGKITTSTDRVLAYLRPDVDKRPWSNHDLWLWGSCLEAKGMLTHGSKEWLKSLKGGAEDSSPSDLIAHVEPAAMSSLDAVAFDTPEAIRGAIRWWLDRCLPKFRRSLAFPCRVAEVHGGAKLREEPKLIVGNVHSLKGSQADVVVFFPDLSQAGMREWCGPAESRDRVRRLVYVALTRAYEELVICQPSSIAHVDVPISA